MDTFIFEDMGYNKNGAVLVIKSKQELEIGHLERSPEKEQLISDQVYQYGLANIEKVKKF